MNRNHNEIPERWRRIIRNKFGKPAHLILFTKDQMWRYADDLETAVGAPSDYANLPQSHGKYVHVQHAYLRELEEVVMETILENFTDYKDNCFFIDL